MLAVLLSFGAGVLTVFNPCVLPILPIVLAAAQNGHKFGIPIFALGMVATYAAAAIFIVSIGISLNISPEDLRQMAAWILLGFGITLSIKYVGARFSKATQSISNVCNTACNAQNQHTLIGQFCLGSLTGLIWAPCTGPTLGVAIALAANSETRLQGMGLMAIFALGAIATLLLFGTILREFIKRNSEKFHASAAHLRYILGLLCILIAALILTKLDKSIEGYFNAHLPQWWADFTTML